MMTHNITVENIDALRFLYGPESIIVVYATATAFIIVFSFFPSHANKFLLTCNNGYLQ